MIHPSRLARLVLLLIVSELALPFTSADPEAQAVGSGGNTERSFSWNGQELDCVSVTELDGGGYRLYLRNDADVTLPDGRATVLMGGWDHPVCIDKDGTLFEAGFREEKDATLQGRTIRVAAYDLAGDFSMPIDDIILKARDGNAYPFMAGEELWLTTEGLVERGTVQGVRTLKLETGRPVVVNACDLSFDEGGRAVFGRRKVALDAMTSLEALDGRSYYFTAGFRYTCFDDGGSGLVKSGALLSQKIRFAGRDLAVAWCMAWFDRPESGQPSILLGEAYLDEEARLDANDGKAYAFQPGWAMSINWNDEGRVIQGVARSEGTTDIRGVAVQTLGWGADFTGGTARFDKSVLVLKEPTPLRAADGKTYRFAQGIQLRLDASGDVILGHIIDSDIFADGRTTRAKAADFSWDGSKAVFEDIRK